MAGLSKEWDSAKPIPLTDEWEAATPVKSVNLAADPSYRKGLEDFVRKEGKRDIKQEAVRGLPMGNRIADSTLGQYADPVHPERYVEQVLGPQPYDNSSKLTPSIGKTPLESTVRGLARFAKNPAPQIEGALAFPVDLVKGLYNAAASPEDGSLSRFAADTVKGAIAPINVLNPEDMNQAWEDNVLGSALIATGARSGVKAAGKRAINAIPESFEMSMYQRGLKGQNGFSGLKTSELNNRLNTALNEGIPLNEKGVNKLKSTVSAINSEVQQRITDYAGQGAAISMDKVLAPVADIRGKAANEAFPTKANNQINSTVNEFRNNPAIERPGFDAVNTAPVPEIPIQQAQNFKQSINRELNDFYDAMNKSPDKASYLARQWVAKTKAKIGDGLRAEISDIFPEVKGLNQREGALIQLNKSLERAVNRIGQRDLLSLKFLTSMITSPKLAVTEYILNNPNVQSNLAIAIRRARRGASGKDIAPAAPGSTPYTPPERMNQADRNVPRIPTNLPVGDNGAAANTVPRIPTNTQAGAGFYFDETTGTMRPRNNDPLGIRQ